MLMSCAHDSPHIQDNRFNKAFDKETGFRTTSILCMAIKNHTGDVLGVLQVMNKKDGRLRDDATCDVCM